MKKTTEQLTGAALDKKIAELRETLRAVRFGKIGAAAKNVKEQGNTRREIARLLTAKNAQK